MTGTDTGAGKTFFTALLIKELRRLGVELSAMKPIETGCAGPVGDAESMEASDVNLIAAALGDSVRENLILEKFWSPVAPSVAASAEGRSLDWDDLLARIDRESLKHQNFIIEGAGGLMVPIVGEKTYVDLVKELELPIVLVVGSKLGAINHAALSFHAAKSLGLNLLGYVFNDMDKEEPSFQVPVNAKATNRKLLAEVASGYQVEELASIEAIRDGGARLEDFLHSEKEKFQGFSLSKKLLEVFSA